MITTVSQISIKSNTPGQAGLPKMPVKTVGISKSGVEGDYNRFRKEKKKNDPDMAVMILSTDVLNALNSVEERFIKKNTLSYKRWHKAKKSMPGGNTRTVLHYDPFPITIKKGEGTLLESLDNDYYLCAKS